MGEHVIGRSTATLWQCLLSGKKCSSMGQHQWMALGYANCKAPCRRQRPPLSCDLHELNILSFPNKRCPVCSSDGNEDRRSCCLYRRHSKGSVSFYKLQAG